jgi:enoyl-CoA hydratase
MPTSEYAGLRVELRDAALWLVLDHPETFNALTADMLLGLVGELQTVVAREDVRVVVLTGAGPAFSAGADLSGDAPQDKYGAEAVEAANALIRAIIDCDKPVVCGLNGVAAGVGASMALACDLVVAKASAALTLGFTKIGLMPDGGATATVAAAVGRVRAMRLALLSDLLGAQEAYDVGLVSHVYADDEYDDGLAKVVGRLASGPPLAQAATKKAVNAVTLAVLPEAFDRERSGQSVLLRTDDVIEGMRAFNEKRRPVFRGR